jgi:hypothetical protein
MGLDPAEHLIALAQEQPALVVKLLLDEIVSQRRQIAKLERHRDVVLKYIVAQVRRQLKAQRQKTPEGEREKALIVKLRDEDKLPWQTITNIVNKGRKTKASLDAVCRIYRRAKTEHKVPPNVQTKNRRSQ